MLLIQNNVYLFGFLFAFLGWIASHAYNLRALSKCRDELVSPLWYIKNRPYKFTLSLISTFMGIFLNIITFNPATITDGTVLSLFITSMFCASTIADQAVDKLGSREHHKRAGTEPDIIDKTKGDW